MSCKNWNAVSSTCKLTDEECLGECQMYETDFEQECKDLKIVIESKNQLIAEMQKEMDDLHAVIADYRRKTEILKADIERYEMKARLFDAIARSVN